MLCSRTSFKRPSSCTISCGGKNINVILLDVPNGSGLKYVPKSWVHDLELHSLKYGEAALLVREEYIVALENLEAQSKVEDSRGIVVFGQPGIGA